MDRAIQKLFQQSFPHYSATHKLPIDFHRAAKSFMQCRTAALGGHVQGCPNGHIERVHYNSCKHRSCPQCNATAVTRWLAKQEERILNCPHYHIIFTLPHELNPLWQHNRKAMNQLLFDAVSKTLMTLLADPQWLGARPAIIAALHSWGRTLSIHPHLHCLVAAGGLDKAGRWCTPKKDFLLPGRVVATLFRGKYLDLIKRRIKAGKIIPPANADVIGTIALCNKLRRKKWNVRLQERYDYAKGVVNYLGRYARGGALKNQQVVAMNNDSVTFRYFDHRRKEKAPMSLVRTEFIRRLLEHVPPYRSQTIRHYGLYSGRSLDKRNQARSLLGQPEEQEAAALDWQACCERMGYTVETQCPECQSRLVTLRTIAKPNRGPPYSVH
jgi:hypothetical protein